MSKKFKQLLYKEMTNKVKNRKLILLRGVSGSGKSTLVSKYNLEDYVLSLDNIRLMLGSTVMGDDGVRRINADNFNTVVSIFQDILEKRMQQGLLTVIDNMNLSITSIKDYSELVSQYGYSIHVINFDRDMDFILNSNKLREGTKKYISDISILERMYNTKIQNDAVIKRKYNVIDSEDVDSINSLIKGEYEDINYYDAIKIIGDIHGCYSVLKEAIGEFDKKVKYIFLGDFIDRGVENVEVINYLVDNFVGKRNVEFICGNHDIYLNCYVNDFYLSYGKEFKDVTKQEFISKNLSKNKVKKLVNVLKDSYKFEYKGKKYFCNHGGVVYNENLGLYNSRELMYGVGTYSFNVDKYWNNQMLELNEDDRIIQFHGHRNLMAVGLDEYQYSYNLESSVEKGEYLRVAMIDKDGIKVSQYKNDVYDKERFKDNVEEKIVKEFLDDAENSDGLIKIKNQKLSDDFISVNFSKKVFYDGLWNNLTSKARGVFIDKNINKVICRGYDKFFNIGEREDLNDLLDRADFPVRAYLKENGYLGMVSYSNKLNEFIFATKSNLIGESHIELENSSYVLELRELFNKTFNKDDKVKLKKYILDNDVSLTFEVISLKDKHLVEYKDDKLILLDIIKNNLKFEKYEYKEVLNLAKRFNKLEVKKKALEFKDKESFLKYYNAKLKDEYKIKDEGYVFEDKNYNVMFKYKANHYVIWKDLRGTFNQVDKISEEEFNKKLGARFDKLLNRYSEHDKTYMYIQLLRGYKFKKYYELCLTKKYEDLLGANKIDIIEISNIVNKEIGLD